MLGTVEQTNEEDQVSKGCPLLIFSSYGSLAKIKKDGLKYFVIHYSLFVCSVVSYTSS
jgi:hypothetical protein